MLQTLQRIWRDFAGEGDTRMTDGGTETIGGDAAETGPRVETQSTETPDDEPEAEDEAGGEIIDPSSKELLDLIAQATFVLDDEGRIVAWNDAIEELTGASVEEALGHEHASEMFYPDGRRAKTLADKVLENP